MSLFLSMSPAVATEYVDGPALAENLTNKVSIDGINRHLVAFQRFADANEGTRMAGSGGHAKSADYVASVLTTAGFAVSKQEFPFSYSTRVDRLSVDGTQIPIIRMYGTPSTSAGGVTAPLDVVAVDDTSGCGTSDYTPDVVGKIALIKRGGCSFAQKQVSAEASGAVGVVIYNNTVGDLDASLGEPAGGMIPAGGVTAAAGARLAALAGQPVTLELRVVVEERTTFNVIAETKGGRKDNIVMLGSHLDSRWRGPGLNDNGTGSAALLETALQLGGNAKVENAVRFGFWSAEESGAMPPPGSIGLEGSIHYVRSLTFGQQLDIAAYLNFDMLGSPNVGYFTYDGDNSDLVGAGPGPYGSAQIERTLTDFLKNAHGVSVEGTDLSGDSDYFPFSTVGIPVGGLFTGANEIETSAQAAKWSGIAGAPFDSCFHQACDNLGNINREALDRNADAVAWAVGIYATSTESINGIKRGEAKETTQKAVERSSERNLTEPVGASLDLACNDFA
ncbi:M28 family peptidase [Amycolatopsis sp. H20-H5]|uniref:M28 family peptidase n=1 Tax=Amycolatopsis sp. H20-H5 TaxID=3046309 RepID=UPI002DB88C09|nr:M28 family peptidase [Amycolatopsis sp. H20-H5]MEC3975473.1 M28 family peptidase [Amycolatopsis sp. H20-H5]